HTLPRLSDAVGSFGGWVTSGAVVRHQDIGVDDPAEAANGLGEKREKRQAIAVAEEDVAAIVAACGDVPHGAGVFKSEWSCHVTEATSDRFPPRRRPSGRSPCGRERA